MGILIALLIGLVVTVALVMYSAISVPISEVERQRLDEEQAEWIRNYNKKKAR